MDLAGRFASALGRRLEIAANQALENNRKKATHFLRSLSASVEHLALIKPSG